MAQWLKFFLAGVTETANSSIETFKNILTLKKKMEEDVLPLFGSRQKKAIDVLNYLYGSPVTTINILAKEINISYATCNRIVSDLVKAGVLKDLELGIKHRWFLFEEYLALFVREAGFREKNENN
jgi:Fic family protein